MSQEQWVVGSVPLSTHQTLLLLPELLLTYESLAASAGMETCS